MKQQSTVAAEVPPGLVKSARDGRVRRNAPAILRCLTLIGLSLVAAPACIPIIETYYEPVGLSHYGPDSPCTVRTTAGVRGHGHGSLIAQVWKVHSPRSLKLSILLEPGHTARLASTEYVIRGGAPEIVQRGSVIDFSKRPCRPPRSAGCQARLSAESEMQGASIFTTHFEVELPIPDAVGNDFFVELPDVLFDGERTSVPLMEFRRHVHGTIAVLCT